MITSPKIEELAFKGVCRWHVFNTGYASAYTLEVPNGGFILLRQIIFHPFYQGATRNAQLLNVAHQLSLVEQGSKTELVYQFRNPVSQVTDATGIGAVHNVATTEATILETWGVFKQNVEVDEDGIPTTFVKPSKLHYEIEKPVGNKYLGKDLFNAPPVDPSERISSRPNLNYRKLSQEEFLSQSLKECSSRPIQDIDES